MLPTISTGNVASALVGEYNVANSVRFNDGDSAYMHKTPGGDGNQRTFTFSCWIKLGDLSGAHRTIFSVGADNNNTIRMLVRSNDKFQAYCAISGSDVIDYQTNRLLRDVSAWMHLCLAVDTTQGTAGDRVKIYINGTQETSFSTTDQPDQNTDLPFSTNQMEIGRRHDNTSQFFDGYMAEVVFIDGLALAPTSFGEFDEDSPTIWKPKDVSGLSFGTNGFYLDFEASDNLGNDANGGTDFTEVNLAAADQATDTCTNNFCTANPLDQYGSYTLSEGNCKISSGHTSWYTIGSTMAVQNGKWYWETEFDSGTMIEIFVGVHDTSVNRTDTNSWLTGSSLFYNDAGGEIRTDGTNSTEDYGTLTAGDILGIALNMDDKQITLYKNGSAIASNVALSSSISEAMPTFLTDANDVIFKVNFGGCSAFDVSSGNADDNGYGNFEYDVPTGYYALCTKNLAEFG